MRAKSIGLWSSVVLFSVICGSIGIDPSRVRSAPPKKNQPAAVKVGDPLSAKPLPLVEAAKLANATAVGADATVGRIDAGSMPRGQTSIDGVPFEFVAGEKNALDVAASMSGVKDPLRNKHFFIGASKNTNGRLVFTVPGDQYSALHVIAFSAGRAGHAARMTVRIGLYGAATGIMEDTVVQVPTLTSGSTEQSIGQVPIKLVGGKPGFLHHLRVPLPQTGNIKEFSQLDLEFTRDMNVHVLPPDPSEFGKIPAGLPSDVVVLAATLEPSPVTMTYATAEPGNVFFDNQKVVFKLTVKNRGDKAAAVSAYAEANGPGTGEEPGVERKRYKAEQKVQLKPGESREVALDVTPAKRGWYACTLGVEFDGELVQRRDTTYAVLAPDTRKAFADSPFGIWEFWHPHSVAPRANQVDMLGSLIHKGGWRWTYGGSPGKSRGNTSGEDYARIREQYKIVWTTQNLPQSYQRGEGWYNEAEFNKVMPGALEYGVKTFDPYFKVLHESRSSLDLLRRYSEFLGGKPYDMPAHEKAKLETQLENVKKYCLGIKRINPQAKIVLFNDYPSVVFQYLSRGFPKEAFDVIGLEGANFLRQPERQPDWMCMLGLAHEMKRAMAKFGYDKPIWTTEALYHPTEAGALSLHDQGVIAVREAMMALQLGISRMTAAGILKDPSDDYHWSNWGSSGYCYRDPEINPKPSYAMYAWLTQVLDQAKPAGKLATPNTSLHVVDFKKLDGGHVYGVWTANGMQTVTLAAAGKPTVYDCFGNVLDVKGENLTLSASPTPLYITGTTLKEVTAATAVESPGEIGKQLFDFDKAEPFQEAKLPNKVIESSWDTLRIMGDFETSFVVEDGATAMKVALKPVQDERKLVPRYIEYQLAKPIVLEDRPYEFALRVKGNSGWGRIMFEVVDAKGRVWTNCGNQYAGASNASDPDGDSFISFEGWRTMHIPLVGMYPGKDQSIYWPRNYNWWPTNSPEEVEIRAKAAEAAEQASAELQAPLSARQIQVGAKLEIQIAAADKGKKAAAAKKQAAKKAAPPRWLGQSPVDYPLKLTKIIVTMRPSILYLDEERPVANPVIFIDKLGVTSPPPGM